MFSFCFISYKASPAKHSQLFSLHKVLDFCKQEIQSAIEDYIFLFSLNAYIIPEESKLTLFLHVNQTLNIEGYKQTDKKEDGIGSLVYQENHVGSYTHPQGFSQIQVHTLVF